MRRRRGAGLRGAAGDVGEVGVAFWHGHRLVEGTELPDAVGTDEVAERVVAVGVVGAEEDQVEQPLEPPGRAHTGEQDREVAREWRGGLAERFEATQQWLCRDEPRFDALGGVAEALEELGGAVGERGEVLERLVHAGRRDTEILEDGDRLCGERFEPLERGTELAQEGREARQVFGKRAAVLGGRGRDRVALREEFRELLAIARDRRKRSGGFDREVAEELVLGGEDAEHLFEFAQRRVGAVQDRVQVAAAPGESGAEFVDDDRQPLVLRQVVDVADLVDSHRTGGLLDGEQPLARAFVPCGDLVQRGRQRRAFGSGLGGQAINVLLADQRLWLDRAGGVDPKVLEAGIGDVQRHRSLALRGGRNGADGADLDAVDLDVLATDHVAGIVEDRAHRVATTRTAGRSGEQDRGNQDERAERAADCRYRTSPRRPLGTRPQNRSFLLCPDRSGRSARGATLLLGGSPLARLYQDTVPLLGGYRAS